MNNEPKYQPGDRIECPDGVLAVIEWVYDVGFYEKDERHYGYSCKLGDGVIEESRIKLYEGPLETHEITPLHVKNRSEESTKKVMDIVSKLFE